MRATQPGMTGTHLEKTEAAVAILQGIDYDSSLADRLSTTSSRHLPMGRGRTRPFPVHSRVPLVSPHQKPLNWVWMIIDSIA